MKSIFALAAVAVSLAASAGREPPSLLVDVDFFDTVSGVRPYCGSNWIDRFFADCKSNGVKSVTWRSVCQIANFPSKLNHEWATLHLVPSAADERRFDGAFAAKVGVGPQPKGRAFGGIRQKIEPKGCQSYMMRAMVSSDALPSGAFIAAIDAESGKVLARSEEVRSYGMTRREIRFSTDRPFYAGAFSAGAEGTHVFVVDNMSLRPVDSPDTELFMNGDMESVDELMEPANWQQDGTRFVTLNGDVSIYPFETRKKMFPNIASYQILDRRTGLADTRILRASEDGDSLALAGKAAKKYGIGLYVWFDPFDDGRRCLPPVKVWTSRFHEEHPEFRCQNKEGRTRWGLLCFACPEVRAYKTAVVRELLSYEGVTGIALKTHYQHNTLWGMSQAVLGDCIYHPAILERYDARWGKPADGSYNHFRLRRLHGEAVMEWLAEMRPVFKEAGARLCMFQAPTDFLDGNGTSRWYLPPEEIIRRRLCDDFLIEPRWRDGDHLKHFQNAHSVKRLINACRESGVRVGFDFYYTAVCRNWDVKARREEMVRQLAGLAKEDVDFLGIYEERNMAGDWPYVRRAADAIAKLPPRAATVPYETAPKSVISLETCRDAMFVSAAGEKLAAEYLLTDVGERDGVCVHGGGTSVLTVNFLNPLSLEEVNVYSGHITWKDKCSAEDFTLEGFSGGAWKALGAVKDGNTLKAKDVLTPNTMRFERQTLEAIRISFTRGINPKYLVVRAITGR